MHPQRRRLIKLIVIGGPLVLGSYALGFVAWHAVAAALAPIGRWFGIG